MVDESQDAGRPQVTLRDVAEAAGVSLATASNALTGARRPSAVTTQRVVDTAKRLGYRRNEVARSLRTGKTNTIALILPDAGDPFWSALVVGVEGAVRATGRSVVLVTTGFDAEREAALLEGTELAVDGAILVTCDPDRAARAIAAGTVPVVTLDEPVDTPLAGRVTSDNEAGGRLAADLLVDRGGRVFAIVEGRARLHSSRERSLGFRRRLAERGIPDERVLRIVGDYSFEGGRSGLRRLLERHPDIDALFCCSDNAAMGALFEARDQRIDVPSQLMVCGFDGIEWTSWVRPTISTIAQDPIALGVAAAAMVTAMIDGASPPPPVLQPVAVVERESTAR